MNNKLNHSDCEHSDVSKPEKNDFVDCGYHSLKMVGPDCDTKRSGPCKPFIESTDEDLPKRITDRLAQIRGLALGAYRKAHG